MKVTDKNLSGTATQQVEFTYDVFDRRIAKEVDTTPLDANDGVVTHFVYNGDNVQLEFVDNDGTSNGSQSVLSKRYLHGAGVDQILAKEDGSSNFIWMLTDHLGTIRNLVNNSGAVVNHLVYDSYGQVISETNPLLDSRYLFTGRKFDSETGLYYYRARYYDANTGRFIGEDSLGFYSQDANFYRYVLNNPSNLTDPLGLLVNAVFNPSNGTLKIIDNDTGRTVIVENVFSGDNTHYPIPPGSYEILEHSHPHWFRLDPIDQYLRNDKDDKSGRFGFRLHPGTISFGCIAVPNNQSDDWNNVENLIRNTSTEKVNDNLGTLSWLRNFLGQKITKFGTIKVLK